MIVGQSIFDTVLDRLTETPTQEPVAASAPWTGVRGLNAGFVGAQSEAFAGQSETLSLVMPIPPISPKT